VVGGLRPDSKALSIYDPATDNWDAARAVLPTQREHLTVTALGGKLYAVGGRWDDRGNLAVLEIYDPATGRWTRGPDLPTPRSGLTAGVLDGHIHSRAASHSRLAAPSASMRRMIPRPPSGPHSPVCPPHTMTWRRPW
jgi:Kelch motif